MDETRVFKTYNTRLDPMDMEFLYDYAAAGYYEDIPASAPRRRPMPTHEKPAGRVRTWTREPAAEDDAVEVRPLSRAGQGISLLTFLGFAVAAILLVLVLFSHIRLTALSESAAECQSRISELTEQQHKLQARYETTFTLSEVEEYATRELGMQKARADQIFYVEAYNDADRAEVVRTEEKNAFALELDGIVGRLLAYFG